MYVIETSNVFSPTTVTENQGNKVPIGNEIG